MRTHEGHPAGATPLSGSSAGSAWDGTSRREFLELAPSDTDAQAAAFDETLTKGQVLAIVKPFIAGGT